MAATEPQPNLRQRRKEQRTPSDETITSNVEEDLPKRDEVVWGKTPGGEGTWHVESNEPGR